MRFTIENLNNYRNQSLSLAMVGANSPKYISQKAFNRDCNIEKAATIDGMKMIGRGSLEVIPIVGSVAGFILSAQETYPVVTATGSGLWIYSKNPSGKLYVGSFRDGKLHLAPLYDNLYSHLQRN